MKVVIDQYMVKGYGLLVHSENAGVDGSIPPLGTINQSPQLTVRLRAFGGNAAGAARLRAALSP